MAKKKAFNFVLGNLFGVPLSWMKNISAKRCSAPFIRIFQDEIIDLLLAHIIWICTGRKDPKLRIALTAGIDTTDLCAGQPETSREGPCTKV